MLVRCGADLLHHGEDALLEERWWFPWFETLLWGRLRYFDENYYLNRPITSKAKLGSDFYGFFCVESFSMVLLLHAYQIG